MTIGQRPWMVSYATGLASCCGRGLLPLRIFQLKTRYQGCPGRDMRRIRGDSHYLSIPTRLCVPKRRCRSSPWLDSYSWTL